MSQYARVVTFDADSDALDALLAEIRAADGPPEGMPAKRLTVLADRAAGKLVVSTRFDSKEDLEKGSAALEAMSPPAVGNISRTSVAVYEVAFEMDA